MGDRQADRGGNRQCERRAKDRRAAGVLAAVAMNACVLGTACGESDHSLLAARDSGPKQDVADATDSSASDSSAAVDAPVDTVYDAADSHDTATTYPDDGPWAMTLVNGLVNASQVRVCFEVSTDPQAGFEPTAAMPVPEDGALAFAHRWSTTALPNVDPSKHHVQLVMFTGELGAIAGKRCDQLKAVPEGVYRQSLAVINQPVLARNRSLLVVLAGCVPDKRLKPVPIDAAADAGEPGDTDIPEAGVGPQDAEADPVALCGPNADADRGNVRLVVASMDRRVPVGQIGLQVMSAVLGADGVTVLHTAAAPAANTTLAQGLFPGVIAPRPPRIMWLAELLGDRPRDNTLSVYRDRAPTLTFTQPLAEAASLGDLPNGIEGLKDGAGYTILLVGMAPDVQLEGFEGLRVTLVPSDP